MQVAPGVSPRAALVRPATASFLAYTSYALCRTPLLPLCARALGAGPSLTGLVMGASTLTGVFVKLPAGALSDLLGRIIAAIVVYATGVATTTAATSAFITDVTQRVRYGAAHGVFGTIYDVGDALGPIAAGVLISCVGYSRMFQVIAACALTMAVVFGVTSRFDPAARAVARS
jgi:MFS family permease